MSAKRVLSQKHKGKKGLAAFLFSRFFLFGLMVVLQVLMFVFFAYNASVEKNLNYVIMVLQFVLIIYIANDKSDPTMKLVWIMFIMFVPAIGCMMYLYFMLQPGSLMLKKRLEHINLTRTYIMNYKYWISRFHLLQNMYMKKQVVRCTKIRMLHI